MACQPSGCKIHLQALCEAEVGIRNFCATRPNPASLLRFWVPPSHSTLTPPADNARLYLHRVCGISWPLLHLSTFFPPFSLFIFTKSRRESPPTPGPVQQPAAKNPEAASSPRQPARPACWARDLISSSIFILTVLSPRKGNERWQDFPVFVNISLLLRAGWFCLSAFAAEDGCSASSPCKFNSVPKPLPYINAGVFHPRWDLLAEERRR